jgi:hypothetical protein
MEPKLAKTILTFVPSIAMEMLSVRMLLMNLIAVSSDAKFDKMKKSTRTLPSNSCSLATNASISASSSSMIVTTDAGQSIQPIGEEIERANIPTETTDTAEATLPQIILLDRESAPTGVISDESSHMNKHVFFSAKTDKDLSMLVLSIEFLFQ